MDENCTKYWKSFVQFSKNGTYENEHNHQNVFMERKKPLPRGNGFLLKGVERREVEKRIYGGERLRLTASAAFHGYSLIDIFEYQLTEI